MAKWALWAAHRYVTAGAAAPRAVGVDGRVLSRPWRIRSEQAVAAARRARGARPQPWWPKVLGWACIGVAGIAALASGTPVARHVALSVAASPGPESVRPSLRLGPLTELPEQSGLAWSVDPAQGPFELVILAEDYREIARIGGIAGSEWRWSSDVAGLLEAGATYHAFLLAGQESDSTRTPLLSFVRL